MSSVLLESTSERKLAQPMPDHVFSYENRVEHFPVVNIERQPDELRRDHRSTRPSFDRRLRIGRLRLVDLVQKVLVDKRAFLN